MEGEANGGVFVGDSIVLICCSFLGFPASQHTEKKEPSFFTCNRCSTRSHSQVNLFPHFHEISHENLRNYIVKTFIFFHSQIGERRWDANGEQHSTNLCFIHKIHNEFCWKRTQERRKLFACLEAWENCYMRGDSLVTMSISNYLFTYEPLNHSHNILQKPFLSTVCLCTLLLHNHTSMLPPSAALSPMMYVYLSTTCNIVYEHMQFMQISTPRSTWKRMQMCLGKWGRRENANTQTPRL